MIANKRRGVEAELEAALGLADAEGKERELAALSAQVMQRQQAHQAALQVSCMLLLQ